MLKINMLLISQKNKKNNITDGEEEYMRSMLAEHQHENALYGACFLNRDSGYYD